MDQLHSLTWWIDNRFVEQTHARVALKTNFKTKTQQVSPP